MRIDMMSVPKRPFLALSLAFLGASAALAGPPFATDDPEPTDTGHWEIYGFTTGTHVPGNTDSETGFDINYGGAKDLQLTAAVALDRATEARDRLGLGDIELSAKYRFLHQSEGSVLPDVAFFPAISLPTASRRFGTGHVTLFLPLWAQKDLGKWSLFGGGGCTINPGAGQRNFWSSGIGLQRAVSERFQLGAEIYRETADADDARRFTGINVGGTYRLSEHWSLAGSAGPGIEHARTQERYAFYLALKADY